MRLRQRLGVLLGITVLIVASLLAYGVQAQDATPIPAEQTLYTGQVTGIPDEFVGVSIIGTDAIVYICDGQADKGTVSIAEWFIGTVANGAIDVTAASGNRVQVALTDAQASGSFTFSDGTVKQFVIGLAAAQSALYRTQFTIGEVRFVGGWLILPDGQVRGAIFDQANSSLTPATFSGFAPLAGAATPEPVG